MKKQISLIALATLMALALAACQPKAEDGANSPTPLASGASASTTPTAIATGSDMLTQQQFTEAMLAMLKEKAPDIKFTMQDAETIIGETEEDTLELYLGNAYNEYAVQGYDYEEVADYYTNAMLEGLADKGNDALSRENILMVIKPLDYVENVRAQGMEPVMDELVDGLYVLYMLDMPSIARPFTEEELAAAGIARDELRGIAIENVEKTVQPLMEVGSDDGVYFITADGMYDSALLLCDIWGDINVQGDYIVGIPDRGSMLVVGSEDAPAIEMLQAVNAEIYSDSSYPISGKLLLWTGSGFEYYE